MTEKRPPPNPGKPDPSKLYWDIKDVAAYWDVKPKTIREYRSRGRGELPKEDDTLGHSPVWKPATIINFTRSRRARTDLKENGS